MTTNEQGTMLLINGVYKFVNYQDTNQIVASNDKSMFSKFRKSSRNAKRLFRDQIENWLES